MTTTNQEVYDALIDAGASEDKARAAAAQIPDKDDVATKKDIAELEAHLYRALWIQALAIIGVQIGVLVVFFQIFGGKG